MFKYIIEDFPILVLVMGFSILLLNDLKVSDNKVKKVKILLFVVAVFTICDTLEMFYYNMETFHFERLLLSFIGYSLRPLICIIFISLLTDNKKINLFYGLAGVNALIYSTCFFSTIAFGFTSDNSFIRGPLGYSSHILCIIYLILFVYLIIKKHNGQSWNKTLMLTFIAFITSLSAVVDYLADVSLFDQTVLICALIYHLFLNMEYNKIDALTGIYNRRTFYNDLVKFKNKITCIVSVDMNNLKVINDKKGHLEGDKALVTLSDAMLSCDKDKARYYRVGGDEFIILCKDRDEKQVKDLLKKLNDNMEKTDYSCSVGYEMYDSSKDIFEVYKIADDKMYKEKEKYHAKYGKKIGK